jgi:hypothetical protein
MADHGLPSRTNRSEPLVNLSDGANCFVYTKMDGYRIIHVCFFISSLDFAEHHDQDNDEVLKHAKKG